MFEILNIALNNEYVYIGIITVLLVVIIITIFSIKKDREKMIRDRKPKEVEQPIEPAKDSQEQQQAKMELEKVVSKIKNDIDNKQEPESEIKSYEQEQEQKAIISYQELVDAVRKNNVEHQAQTEIGMEVADQNVIEEPTTVEEQQQQEVVENKVDDLLTMLGSQNEEKSEPVFQETTIEEHKEELPIEHTTVTQTTIYKEEPADVFANEMLNKDRYQAQHGFHEPEVDTMNIDLSSNASVDSPEAKLLDSIEQHKEEKKYQRTDFISPIYGKQETSNYAPINNNKIDYEELTRSNISRETRESRLENSAPVDLGTQPIDVDDRHQSPSIDDIINDELKDNDEFLNALKDFRQNL